ncbi:GroES-like protein [Fomes fomentarius]|nr:GroES-like protein [Fomes fomentarius]
MAPLTQKALIVPEPKAPWKLVADWPVATPGPKEVLVKVISAAINPVDHAIQAYTLPFITVYPHLGGIDGSGVVEEVGVEVEGFVKGDRVLFACGSNFKLQGTFQEYSLEPAESVVKIPDNITFDQAASIPLCLATAVTGLWSHHREAQSVNFLAPWEEGGTTKYAGQAAFIVGGSSSVGQFVIQAARIQGFSPIVTTSSLQHEQWLKSLGATHVLDRSLAPSEILAALPKATGGKPVVYAFDAISQTAETQNLAYDALAAGGSLVVVHPQSEAVLADKVARDGGSKKVVRPWGSFDTPANRELGQELYPRLTEWLEKGTLVPNRVQIIPGGLNGVPEACELLMNKNVSGVKLVVHVQETA